MKCEECGNQLAAIGFSLCQTCRRELISRTSPPNSQHRFSREIQEQWEENIKRNCPHYHSRYKHCYWKTISASRSNPSGFCKIYSCPISGIQWYPEMKLYQYEGSIMQNTYYLSVCAQTRKEAARLIANKLKLLEPEFNFLEFMSKMIENRKKFLQDLTVPEIIEKYQHALEIWPTWKHLTDLVNYEMKEYNFNQVVERSD